MSGPLKSLGATLFTPGVAALARKAAAAESLTDRVRAELAEPLRPHLVSASRRGGDLVVIMDSGAWTPRVRYGAQELKQRLEARGETPIGKVVVKVRAAKPVASG
jgi:hypothetical protein